MSQKIISRLAPTPSGFLHVGNGVNFVLTYLLVRKSGGVLYLRVDDYDTIRVKNEYIDNIFASLEWLGIDWDMGPKSPTHYHKDYKFNKERYFYELSKLESLLYPCECSRKDIAKISHDGKYPNLCTNKNLKYDPKIHSLRVFMQDFENFIVWRKGDLPSYNFASLVDDKTIKTSLIVRGEDLRRSTNMQLKLAKILNINTFINAKFIHHKLCTDKNGEKLSKSVKSPSLLNEKSKRFIYKKVANILKLPTNCEDNLDTLKQAFIAHKTF